MDQTHERQCDVLVAGGGPAGVPCAVAAARQGAKVILCQDRPVLGGNASSEVRMHIVGADASGKRGQPLAVETREGGIIEEIRLDTAARNPQRSASMLDLILYERCRAEENLTLMLNTSVRQVEMKDQRIAAAWAERPSTQDRFRIQASTFIDCTGDGRLGAEAGAAYQHGREDKEAFGESLAQDQPDGKTLGSTLLFQARKHDRPMPFVPPPWARKFTEEDLKLRPHATGKDDHGLEYGYWWVEWGGQLDTIKDNETIRDELLAIMLGVWDHVKNGGDHGAANWALDWFGFLPGKRESRRFIGQYILREQDVLNSQPFEDAIAFGGWPIDPHPPEGVDAPEERPCTQTQLPHLYDIPLRCCVARDLPNLMFAGRNISATHVGFATTRVMATCAVMGQGVGTAAAYGVRHDKQPGELANDPQAMHAIQQALLREDCYLIGQLYDDEHDVARQARVTASSEQADGPAQNVLSGQTRAVHGELGVKPDRAHPGTHRWMSDPAAGLPAWIELAWDKPIRPHQIRLIFDTGMHRVLTLSHADAYTRKMCWGQPQTETVRDYRIEASVDGTWRTLVEIQGNHQRYRLHEVTQPPEITAMRLHVDATHGLDHARLIQISVHEQPPAF